MPMNPEVLATAMAHVVSVAMLIVAWKFFYVPIVVEEFKQRVFQLRRELFLFMAEGNISPEHPEYRQLRDSMNVFLRHAHRMSFTFVFASMYAFGRTPDQEREADMLVRDEKTRAALLRFRVRLASALFKNVRRRTPMLWVARWFVYLPIRKLVDVSRVTRRVLLRIGSGVLAESRLLDEACEA